MSFISNLRNTVLSQLKDKYAPVMAIFLKKGYDPDNFEIYLNAGVLGLTINGTSFSTTIDVDNKTPKQISAELAEKNYPIEIKALVDGLPLLSSEYKTIGSDSSPIVYSSYSDVSLEGAVLIRAFRHSIHYLEDTRINLELPYFSSSYEPWYPRIQSGTVSVVKDGKKFIFSVPEYETQEWDLYQGKPYKRVYGEPGRLITDKKVRVSRTPIFWNGSNIEILTDNEAYHPSYIEDVDRWNGFVYTKNKLPTNNSVIFNYTYKERYYVYKGIDLNPTFTHNPLVLNKVVLFYLIPWKSDSGIFHSKTVMHSVGSTVEDARNRIKDYGFPILILGAIHVNNKTSFEDISILDTRTLGGGLYKEDKEVLVQAYPELNYLFDVGVYDGIPYPGNSSVVFSIPNKYLKSLDRREISNRATRNLSAGILPIYDYYEDKIDFSKTNNVSLFSNGDFSSRKYWTEASPKLINNYFAVTTGDYTSIEVSNNVLTLRPQTVVSQSYFKTSAAAKISYYERTSPDGIEYGSWELKTFEDKRTTNGFLLKGKINLSSNKQYKQIKEVSVDSGFENSYFFKEDLYSRIKQSFSALTGISDESGKITGSSPWSGPTNGQVALLDLWPDPSVTGYLKNIGNSIVDSLYADSSGLSMPRLYSPESGFYLDNEYHDWTNSLTFLSRLYDLTSIESYQTAANSIVSAINAINPYESNLINYITTLSGFYFIPHQYKYNGTYFESKEYTLSYTGEKYAEIYPGATDVEYLLDGAQAFSWYNNNSFDGFRSIMAGESSAKIFASSANFSDGLWSPTGWFSQGETFTGNGYYTFDYLGKKAGHNLHLMTDILSRIDVNAIPESSSRLYPAIISLIDSLHYYFDDLIDYYGWFDQDFCELIIGLLNLDSNNEHIEDLSSMYLRGLMDKANRLHETSSFQGEPSYINPRPLNHSLIMASKMIDKDSNYKGISELLFRHNDYLYNNSGVYVSNTLTESPDYQFNHLEGMIELYQKWLTL